MRTQKIRYAFASVLSGLALLGAQPAAAQAFPSKPIQLVIPFAPGDTDQMLRPFTDKMGEFLGQPIVMNYKPGAGGGVGAGQVATSKADGYTLVGSSPGSLVVVPLANKEMKYTTDSFQPVAALSEGVMMIVVQASSPYKSIKDVVEQAKQSPGKITFSSSGSMGITHLLAEIFGQDASIKMTHIPYQGSAPAITALLGGHVQMASTAVAPANAHLKAGTLRALAVFSDKRMKAFPDVPTLKEMGYNLGSPTLYGILAPKGTPKEVVDALQNAARKVVEKYGDPVTQTLSGMGAEVKLLGPDEYSAYLKGQAQLFAAGIKTLGN